MNRITCAECKQPLVLYGLGAVMGLAATNAIMFDRGGHCPFEPSAQFFYGSGLQKGLTPSEETMTYHSDIGSIYGLVKSALGAVCTYGTGHCCCLPEGSAKVAPAMQ